MYDNHTDHVSEATGIIRELLRNPTLKDDMRQILKSIDPESGRAFVKAFLWQDIEFTLGLLGGLPVIANTLIRALDEIVLQMNDKFSPELLQGYVGSVLQDIDTRTLNRSLQNLRPLIEGLTPLFKKAWEEAQKGEQP